MFSESSIMAWAAGWSKTTGTSRPPSRHVLLAQSREKILALEFSDSGVEDSGKSVAVIDPVGVRREPRGVDQIRAPENVAQRRELAVGPHRKNNRLIVGRRIMVCRTVQYWGGPSPSVGDCARPRAS